MTWLLRNRGVEASSDDGLRLLLMASLRLPEFADRSLVGLFEDNARKGDRASCCPVTSSVSSAVEGLRAFGLSSSAACEPLKPEAP